MVLNDINKYQGEFFNLLIDSVKDYAIFMIDPEGRVASWNKGAEHIKGYTGDEILGHNIKVFYTPADIREKKPENNLLLARERGYFKGEGWRVRKDGSLFWADVVFTSLWDEQGKLRGYSKVTRDITEKRDLQEEVNRNNTELEARIKARTEDLLTNELRFSALIENSSEGISLSDEYSNIIYRSPSSVKITGLVSKDSLMSGAHPDDLEAIKSKLADSLKSPGVPVSYQGRFLHASGYYFWMEGTMTNMLHVRAVGAIVVNYRDVTDRKETEDMILKSEKMYRGLFDNMHHGYAYCKSDIYNGHLSDFTFLSVNEEYEQQLDLHEILGKKISEVLPGVLRSYNAFCGCIERVIESGISEKLELYITRLNKWFTYSIYSPAKGYFVLLIENITERKEALRKIQAINWELEKKIIKRSEDLKRKNEELEAFTYSVSHDLRAPLRSIIGFTTILEEEYSSKLDAEAKRLTSVIKSSTEKMGNLIDDLLAFSRLGRNEINRSLIDSHKMVQQVILDIGQKNAETNIIWNIHSLYPVMGDQNLIRQVWANLISNAMKYSGKRIDPEIELSSIKESDQVIFQVKDNGVGFDMKYAKKLFKVFQRLHGMNEFEGTGVGLAIVEKIISSHGGKVWAEAIPNEGSRFYFSLPMKHDLSGKI
jgi:PAS domain S-box-containing protein